MKSFIILIFLIAIAQSVRAEYIDFDCTSTRRGSIEIDASINTDHIFGNMVIYDRVTNYYAYVNMQKSNFCERNMTCYVGSDFNYNYDFRFPTSVLRSERPRIFRTISTLHALRRRDFQRLRINFNCLVY